MFVQGVWDKAVTVHVNAVIDIGLHQMLAEDGLVDAFPSSSAGQIQRRGRVGRIINHVFI